MFRKYIKINLLAGLLFQDCIKRLTPTSTTRVVNVETQNLVHSFPICIRPDSTMLLLKATLYWIVNSLVDLTPKSFNW